MGAARQTEWEFYPFFPTVLNILTLLSRVGSPLWKHSELCFGKERLLPALRELLSTKA